MSLEVIYKNFDTQAKDVITWFRREISGLRTSRVTINLIESIQVEHYGARTALLGLASISTADARTLIISPWDISAIPAIEKALTQSQLGVNPVLDGKIIRLSFPAMSEEMRKKIIKQLHQKAEEARIRLRQDRDEALGKIKSEQRAGSLSEDSSYAGKKVLNTRIDSYNNEISQIVSGKEDAINQI